MPNYAWLQNRVVQERNDWEFEWIQMCFWSQEISSMGLGRGNPEFSENSPACATIEVWLEPKLLWELKINVITISMNAGFRLAVT